MSAEDQKRAMERVAAIVARSLAESAKGQHDALVEASHTAALAADKLRAAAVGQGIGMAEITVTELEAILAMMRDIQNKAHLAFLAAQGTEADYQAAGRRVAQRYSAPIGRARKPKAGA